MLSGPNQINKKTISSSDSYRYVLTSALGPGTHQSESDKQNPPRHLLYASSTVSLSSSAYYSRTPWVFYDPQMFRLIRGTRWAVGQIFL